jgi:hypothetical protein
MELVSAIVVLFVAVGGAGLLYLLSSRIRAGRKIGLRSLDAYAALRRQSAKSVEAGRGLHFSIGRANLTKVTNPTGVAVVSVLDYVNNQAASSDIHPLVTAGDGSMFLAAQDSLRGAYRTVGRKSRISPSQTQYVAADDQAMAYAAGASSIVSQGQLESNLLIGRYGAEIAILTETADREGMDQVIGSDDPTALAIAVLATDKVLLGEELFAAGAYLNGEPVQIASLQLQDILRVLAIVGILLVAIVNLVVG